MGEREWERDGARVMGVRKNIRERMRGRERKSEIFFVNYYYITTV